jgi:hypothetical protein
MYPSPFGGVQACGNNDVGKMRDAASINKIIDRNIKVLTKAEPRSQLRNREIGLRLAGVPRLWSLEKDISPGTCVVPSQWAELKMLLESCKDLT